MFHQGHLNILRAARERCDRLVVGVTSDEALIRMKGRAPVIPLKERCDLVSSLRFVDAVVVDLDQDKRLAWRLQPFDVLFKGDDWKGTPKGAKLEAEMAEVGARVVYLPYTPSTSSTKLRRFIAPEDFSDDEAAAAADEAGAAGTQVPAAPDEASTASAQVRVAAGGAGAQAPRPAPGGVPAAPDEAGAADAGAARPLAEGAVR